jgi:hypothetical protein
MNRRARRLYLMGEKSCLKSADARDAGKKLTFMAFYPRVYVVYRRVYILLCSWCSWCWEAFNQTWHYFRQLLIRHDQT